MNAIPNDERLQQPSWEPSLWSTFSSGSLTSSDFSISAPARVGCHEDIIAKQLVVCMCAHAVLGPGEK